MASNNYRRPGQAIAPAAIAALLSPQARRLARKGMGYALAGAIKTGHIVVRGTWNPREASTPVTKFDANNPKGTV